MESQISKYTDEPIDEVYNEGCNINIYNKELRDEVVQKLSVYGKKWNEINAMHHIWFYMNFGFEYGTENDKSEFLEKMYKTVPMFFTISRISIERTSRIELIKLFEGPDNGTMMYLRKYLDDVAEELFNHKEDVERLLEINKSFKKNMDEYHDTIEALKEIRHKHLAHNDLDYFDNTKQVYKENEVKIDKVFEIIENLYCYLTDVSKMLNASVCIRYGEILDIQSLEMYFR